MQGVRGWLRSHPLEADLALAGLLVLLSSGQSIADPLILVIGVVLAGTVVFRRQYPVQAFGVAATVALLQIGLGLRPENGYVVGAWQPTVADVAIAVLLYTLAAQRPRRDSVAGLAVCFFLSALAIARWPASHSVHAAADILGAAALLASVSLTAWVLGDSSAYRRRIAYTTALEHLAARLEDERDAQARIAAAAERARELEERRARAVDESAARLRRIERDLHDGAQVRLAALAMNLGEAKEALEAAGGDDAASRALMLIGAAHRNAKETLAELRDLARGIHPPVLDRGLDAALRSLSQASAMPVKLAVDMTDRPSPAIEAIAYFCAAELLANVAKHSSASHAAVSVTQQAGGLVMSVTDDGVGEAHISPGGGLAGLLERVQTVDGQLVVLSPAGGPTCVTVQLPGHA